LYLFVDKEFVEGRPAIGKKHRPASESVLNSSVITTAVASGSCASRPDWLSSLQLAICSTWEKLFPVLTAICSNVSRYGFRLPHRELLLPGPC
jgi:hypothetical protein